MWALSPTGPVVMGFTGREPQELEIWRLMSDSKELRHCATIPGDLVGRSMICYDIPREIQPLTAIEEDRLWVGLTDPSGLVCLDSSNRVTRIDYPGAPAVIGAGEGVLYALANSGTEEQELRAIELQ